jgi:hypothetical protein
MPPVFEEDEAGVFDRVILLVQGFRWLENRIAC